MKIFDEEKIKTYRNLEELVSSNVFVGRRDGLLLGIDERTIDELRNYMYKANMYDKQKEVLDKIKEYINNYDVFKEFSFPLMKREEENQVKSSIDYQFNQDIKKDILELLEEIK